VFASGEVIDTVGGLFELVDEETVTVRAADVVAAPRLSLAIAVREYVPAATLLHVALYGLEVSDPTNADPA
jgi:hypothetical protein